MNGARHIADQHVVIGWKALLTPLVSGKAQVLLESGGVTFIAGGLSLEYSSLGWANGGPIGHSFFGWQKSLSSTCFNTRDSEGNIRA
jgi:hypothetical protein